jgi:hypothetical protein
MNSIKPIILRPDQLFAYAQRQIQRRLDKKPSNRFGVTRAIAAEAEYILRKDKVVSTRAVSLSILKHCGVKYSIRANEQEKQSSPQVELIQPENIPPIQLDLTNEPINKESVEWAQWALGIVNLSNSNIKNDSAKAISKKKLPTLIKAIQEVSSANYIEAIGSIDSMIGIMQKTRSSATATHDCRVKTKVGHINAFLPLLENAKVILAKLK